MNTLSGKHQVFYFDQDIEPAITIEVGEEIAVETIDSAIGQFNTSINPVLTPLQGVQPGKSNPQTGPIAVRGAQPGDTLVVHILDIQSAAQGYMAVAPGVGLGNARWGRIEIVRIEAGYVYLTEQVRFPVRPMIGTIGVAPAGERVPATHNGPHGGNLDLTMVTTGSKIYLPVHKAGGLLCMGDVHAAQGDGELAGSAVEVNATVQIRCEVLHGQRQRPWIETATTYATCACAPGLEEAIRLATIDMVDFIQMRLGITTEEANMLVTAIGSARIGAAGGWGIDVTAAVEVPKELLM